MVLLLKPVIWIKKQLEDLVAYEKRCKMEKEMKGFGKDSCIFPPYNLAGCDHITIGSNTTVLEYSRINVYPDAGGICPQVSIGNNCYIGYYFSLLAGEDIIIEDDVLIASNVLINSHSHGHDPESEQPYLAQPLSGKSISIGEGSWIGEKASILPGVKIGKKCIIGANSVVTKSVPDFSIAVGAPARVIKRYNFETHIWEKVEKQEI